MLKLRESEEMKKDRSYLDAQINLQLFDQERQLRKMESRTAIERL